MNETWHAIDEEIEKNYVKSNQVNYNWVGGIGMHKYSVRFTFIFQSKKKNNTVGILMTETKKKKINK